MSQRSTQSPQHPALSEVSIKLIQCDRRDRHDRLSTICCRRETLRVQSSNWSKQTPACKTKQWWVNCDCLVTNTGRALDMLPAVARVLRPKELSCTLKGLSCTLKKLSCADQTCRPTGYSRHLHRKMHAIWQFSETDT